MTKEFMLTIGYIVHKPTNEVCWSDILPYDDESILCIEYEGDNPLLESEFEKLYNTKFYITIPENEDFIFKVTNKIIEIDFNEEIQQEIQINKRNESSN